MNNDWIDFLNSNNATLTDNLEMHVADSHQIIADSITAVVNLSIIQVSGSDAADFLQGQLTCNIKEIDSSTSFFAAFCNAKGRTISTLLITKHQDSFLLIAPAQLTDKIINKLKMYVLRADVQIQNASEQYCLTGITSDKPALFSQLPETNFKVCQNTEIIIKFPANNKRYLVISTFDQAKSLWQELIDNHQLSLIDSSTWDYQDISAGIPWLTVVSSEEYIPQMLNIDKLGGISFNKGCYTGQEIVARTHYLGKSKRELFLAESDAPHESAEDLENILMNSEQFSGKILSLKSNNKNTRILLVMPTAEASLNTLVMTGPKQPNISIIDFQ